MVVVELTEIGAVSGIPFNGPVGAARVGFTDAGGYLLNPTYAELKESRLDMVVAGTSDAVLMVESEAQEMTVTRRCRL